MTWSKFILISFVIFCVLFISKFIVDITAPKKNPINSSEYVLLGEKEFYSSSFDGGLVYVSPFYQGSTNEGGKEIGFITSTGDKKKVFCTSSIRIADTEIYVEMKNDLSEIPSGNFYVIQKDGNNWLEKI